MISARYSAYSLFVLCDKQLNMIDVCTVVSAVTIIEIDTEIAIFHGDRTGSKS